MMKIPVQINLELQFSEEEWSEYEIFLKAHNTTANQHISEEMKKILIKEADIPEEAIKEIIVKGE